MIGILSETEIKAILKNNVIGRIGCSAHGKTYVVPITFVFVNDYLLCHSYDGMKIDMMRNNPSVCFEVDEITTYNSWQSVIVQGVFEELNNGNDIVEAKRNFSGRLLHIKISETALPPEERRSFVSSEGPRSDVSIFYRIRISEMSGRFEK